MSEYDEGYQAGRNAPNLRESYQNVKIIGNMAAGGVALDSGCWLKRWCRCRSFCSAG